MMKKNILLMCFTLMVSFSCLAQDITENDSVSKGKVINKRFNYSQFIVPSTLIVYGLYGLESGQIKHYNYQIRNAVTENIDRHTTIDDFSKWAPTASVYALNAIGVEGKNNLRDRSVIIATSYILTTAVVFGLKSVSNIERPDGTTNDSFPSGHTAIAFAGAEFLWQEYKHKSIWYGIAGYTVAAGTGLFRMYNNRHWLTDVAVGAGIGIFATKIAYWTQPLLKRALFGTEGSNSTSAIVPSYDGKHIGLSFVKTF